MKGISILLATATAGILAWLLWKRRSLRAETRVREYSSGAPQRNTGDLTNTAAVPGPAGEHTDQHEPAEETAGLQAENIITPELQAAAAVGQLGTGIQTNLESGSPEPPLVQPSEPIFPCDHQPDNAAMNSIPVLGQMPANPAPVPLVGAAIVLEGLPNVDAPKERPAEIQTPAEETAPEFASNGVVDQALEHVTLREDGENDASVQPATAAPSAVNGVEEIDVRIPQRYRPPTQKPPRQTEKRNGERALGRPRPSEVISGIRVRLSFDRFGFCSFSLLPERSADLDEEVAVTAENQQLRLFAQEIWYQDLPFSNATTQLRQGLELAGRLADGRRARWLLTGRDLYVLASHQHATGFISTNRLALGRSHVVLCITEMLEAVEAILQEAGCSDYTKLDESEGVPPGWVALRGVSPHKAIPLESGSDPFYAVKPPPDIEIEIEGGLCLHHSVWLAGYPPRIKLLGDLNVGAGILIDGKDAIRAEDGSLTVDGYDLVAQHTVYVEGLSCSASYAIEEPPSVWEQWPAHRCSQAAVCGPLVELEPDLANSRIVSVPMSNPVLLGASPGQIFYCSRRSVGRWKGYVPFEPVWALPSSPLISNKKTASIIQLSGASVSAHSRISRAMLSWSNTILDASRKGLRIDRESSEARARWNAYKKAARSIWRASR